MEKHKTKAIFIIVLILQIMVAAFYMNSKQFMHCDELFCYEGAHNAMLYRFGDVKFRLLTDEGWWNAWHTREEFMEHFEVRGDESILSHSLTEVKGSLKTNNIYYILLNIAVSLQNDPAMTKWSGFMLNIIFFILHQILLFLIGKEIFHDKRKALLPMIIYGFSAGAISLIVYIRFYVLKSLLCLLIAYIHIKLMERQNLWGVIAAYVVTGLAMLALYGNQPYIVIYMALAVFVFMITCLICRQYKLLLKYIGAGFVGVLAVVLLVPTVTSRLLGYAESEYGVTAINNFFKGSIRDYVKWAFYYGRDILHHTTAGIYGAILLMIMFAVIWYLQKRKGKLQWKKLEYLNAKACFMIGTSICYYIIFCKVIFTVEYRYVSCIYPGICVGIAVFLDWLLEFASIRKRGIAICAVVLAGLLICHIKGYIYEIYPEAADMREELAKYPDADNVYVFRDPYIGQYYRDGYLSNEGTRQYLMDPDDIDSIDYGFLDELNGAGFLCWFPFALSDEEIDSTLNHILSHTMYADCKKMLTTYECDVYYVY